MPDLLIPLAIATIVPLIVLYGIYRLDLYGTGTFSLILLCFLWGIVAFGMAYELNPALQRTLGITFFDRVRYSGPITEEILKGLILVALVRRPKFIYFVDGAIYGFAIGIGFAIVENVQYLSGLGADTGLSLAVSRVISTNLMHATASGLVGIGLGMARFQKRPTSIWTFIFSLIVAMLIHVGFNNMVTRPVFTSGGYILLYAGAVGVLGTGTIVMYMRQGLRNQHAWIAEKITSEEGVTNAEAAIVKRLDEADDLLEPLEEIFGKRKAAEIEHFLTLQAKLGILRKVRDKLTDEKMQADIDKEIISLREHIDEARRSVGSYAMLAVRSIFPEERDLIWGTLEDRLPHVTAQSPLDVTGAYTKLKRRLPVSE